MPRSAAQPIPLPDSAELKRLHCSFCGRDGARVRFLTAGTAGGMICDACCVKACAIFVKAYASSALRFVLPSRV